MGTKPNTEKPEDPPAPAEEFAQENLELGQLEVWHRMALEAEDRLRESSVMLSIYEDFTHVRDKETLLSLIEKRIHPLFGFDDWGLFVLEKDGVHLYDFFTPNPQHNSPDVNKQVAAGL